MRPSPASASRACCPTRSTTRAVREGLLAVVLEAFEPAPLPVSLVYSSQRRLPLKLRAFLDFAAPRLRERMHPGSG